MISFIFLCLSVGLLYMLATDWYDPGSMFFWASVGINALSAILNAAALLR